MKSRCLMLLTAITLFAALAMPFRLAAQDNQGHNQKHHHYRIIDVGTFGGPNSYVFDGQRLVNGRGVASGIADTSTPDPFYPNCFFPECLVVHTFQWKNGVLTDLGALVDGVSSGANWINSKGVVAGISENGMTDDHAVFPPEFDAVVWKDGQIINLGTFGGTFSYANAINDAGQVVGFALNTTPDSFDLGDLCLTPPMPTQMRAFLWQGGKLRDLGTLGTGTDSCALFVNRSGQAAGHSFTNTVVNPVTGLPTVDPFLWNGKKLVDLGTLGGTLGLALSINNLGQVVGNSNLPGDLAHHPFIWPKHRHMNDLGTFGGSNGEAANVNDDGDVAGSADFPGDQIHHAALWRDGGMTDLGTVAGDPCSRALSINSRGQIVGTSSNCYIPVHAFLWENGGPMIDLNTFVPPGSGLTLTAATYINNPGEIAVQAVLPNGDTHAVLLIPCDENHDDTKGCEDGESATAVTQSSRAAFTENPTASMAAIRARLAHRYPYRGFGTYQPK
jgi:probable HAF family extracellular repeat protein